MEIGLCHICKCWFDGVKLERVGLVGDLIDRSEHICLGCLAKLKGGAGLKEVETK